jgi:hypothetical protein
MFIGSQSSIKDTNKSYIGSVTLSLIANTVIDTISLEVHMPERYPSILCSLTKNYWAYQPL